MTTLQDIKNDIMELRGTTVSVFGQPTHMRENVPDNECTIDILDIIDALAEFQTDEFDEYKSVNDAINTLDDIGVIDFSEGKSDNSYNWSAPVSNDFDYTIYNTDCGDVLITFKVHRYGDVRCNYTDECILKCSSDYEFYEAISDCSKYMNVDVDGQNYYFDIDPLSDTYEVYDNNGDYIGSIWSMDLEEARADIKEILSKN